MYSRIMKIAVAVIRSIKPHLPYCFTIWIAYGPYISLTTEKEIEQVTLKFIKTRPGYIKQPHFRFNRCRMPSRTFSDICHTASGRHHHLII